MSRSDKPKGADDDVTRVRSIIPMRDGGSGRDRAYLVVLAGLSRGTMFKLDVADTIIGRSPEARIRLNDEGVSREHAAIRIDQGHIVLDDLGSTNGTFCNGERVHGRHALVDGDKIMIGATTILKFTYNDLLDERFQQQMYESALRDGLTKAFNRQHFNELLAKEFSFAARHSVPLSLLFIDIDFFKKVNDTHGHPAGDHVLSEVAASLMSTLRTEDVLARFGGEEFCVLARETDRNGARELAERLRVEIEGRHFGFAGKHIPITISVGVAVMPDPSMTQPGALLVAADRALYEAKRAGRNRVVVADSAGTT